MSLKAKSHILDINSYKAGLSKAGKLQEVIKLSSNENALGTSPKAIAAYEKHSAQIFRYADGGCEGLKEAIANKYNIKSQRIVCGAGSDEIIALLCQAFAGEGDEVLYSEYGFLMYPISAKRVGAKPVIAKESDLKTNLDNLLSQISAQTKIIFIANPNNPTGSYINKQDLEGFINAVPDHIMIVLDLAYAEFVDLPDYPDAVELVNKYENVVMTRTFSKIYGLASLRIGWSYSSDYVADVLNRVRGPFNVGGPAQFAAIAALNDEDFTQKSKNHNDKWLKIIAEELKKLGLKTYPSIGNFILIDFLSEEKASKANQFLLDNGVILRSVAAYKLPSCLRMTIGTESENLKTLELLSKIN
ncbi:MAG: histidinol-phosphate transaminase [Proteobacteria bacterium]|nr:histidinol-phosphate transaminase [Pseudomonadota bacterium]